MSAERDIEVAASRIENRRRELGVDRPIRAVLEFPEAPAAGFVPCPGCEQPWTRLESSGVCIECEEAAKKTHGPDRTSALVAAGVPSRFVERAFQEPAPWPQETGGTSLGSWEGHPELVTLRGPTDTGKTMMAVELVSRRPGRGRWVTAGRIPGIVIEDRGWDGLVEPATLLVDELGRGHNRDGWEYVYGVIAERWNWKRPTLVTTNLTLAELDAAHPALARRLRDGWVVPLSKPWNARKYAT